MFDSMLQGIDNIWNLSLLCGSDCSGIPLSISYYYLFINIFIMNGLPNNEQIKLAIEGLNLRPFIKASLNPKLPVQRHFDMASKTLIDCLNETASCEEIIANGWKLSDIEEDTLSKWILDMYEHGLPLQISNVWHLTQLLLATCLKSSKSSNY